MLLLILSSPSWHTALMVFLRFFCPRLRCFSQLHFYFKLTSK